MENKKSNINFSGERALEKNNDLFEASLERYKFALSFLKNEFNVLDIACGSGYGTFFIASLLKKGKIIGADISSETIEYCNNKYKLNNLQFIRQNALSLNRNFIDKFNLIISFETIEHFTETDIFLENMNLYLKSGGIFIISTPNNFKKINPPKNKYHKYEFDLVEMHKKIKNIFYNSRIECFGQVKTNIKRGSIKKEKILRRILKLFISLIYNIDSKIFNLLYNFSNLKIYKKIGRMQRAYKTDFEIYKINEFNRSTYYNPETSVFVIYKK